MFKLLNRTVCSEQKNLFSITNKLFPLQLQINFISKNAKYPEKYHVLHPIFTILHTLLMGFFTEEGYLYLVDMEQSNYYLGKRDIFVHACPVTLNIDLKVPL